MGSFDPSPGTCSFGLRGEIMGAIGGSPVVSQDVADIGCADPSPGYAWQLLFQGWAPLSQTASGTSFSSSQPVTMRRSASPSSSAACEDDQTPANVTLTFTQSTGGYDFAAASVSADYLRGVDISIQAGPSTCDLASATITLTGEQRGEQLKFTDVHYRACPE
jgi:hypothetical protein